VVSEGSVGNVRVWIVLEDHGTSSVSELHVAEVLAYEPDRAEMKNKYGKDTEVEEWEVRSK
jgi:hypothetical protein